MGFSLHATLDPDAALATTNWTVTGTGSFVTALSDGSDGTYARQNAYPGASLTMGLADTPALPSQWTQFTGVRVNLRVENTTVITDAVTARLQLPSGNIGQTFSVPALSGIIELAGPIWYSRPDGVPWSAADINAMTCNVAEVVGSRVYKLSVSVFINWAPTLSPSPLGTVTTTTRPWYPWAYSDIDGDPQERVGIKLFSGSGAVLDPETETARLLWDSGAIITAGNSYQQPFPLDAAASYRWAIHGMDAGSTFWGPWNQDVFSTSITPPDAPTVYVIADQPNNRVLVLPEPGGGASTEFYQVERSEDVGLTWQSIAGFFGGHLTADEGGFETSTAGWIANSGITGSPVRSNTVAFAGSWSLRVTITGTVGQITLPALRLVVPGVHHEFRARFRAASSFAFAHITIVWRGPDTSFISQEEGAPVTDNSSSWTTLVFLTGPAPAGAHYFQIYITWTGATAGAMHYVDGIAVRPLYYDYASPRLASSLIASPIQYRTVAGHVLAYDGGPPTTVADYVLGAPTVTALSPAIANDCTTWLKNPYDASQNMVIEANANLDSVSHEDLAAHGASGRPDWAVFRGTVRLETGTLSLQIIGDAQWHQFELLEEGPSPAPAPNGLRGPLSRAALGGARTG